MSIRERALIILGGIALIIAAFMYPQWRPAPTVRQVEIDFPDLPVELRASYEALPPRLRDLYLALAEENPALALELVTARLASPARLTNEQRSLPQATMARAVLRRSFAPITLTAAQAEEDDRVLSPYQALFQISGAAIVYQYPDGQRILRLEDLQATNALEMRVILARRVDPINVEELGVNYVDLGPLQSSSGSQHYAIPAETDLSLYGSVVIYCVRSSFIIGVAALG